MQGYQSEHYLFAGLGIPVPAMFGTGVAIIHKLQGIAAIRSQLAQHAVQDILV